MAASPALGRFDHLVDFGKQLGVVHFDRQLDKCIGVVHFGSRPLPTLDIVAHSRQPGRDGSSAVGVVPQRRL